MADQPVELVLGAMATVAVLFFSNQVANSSGSCTTTVERMPPWYGPQSSAQMIG
jgi:hypothetical protein